MKGILEKFGFSELLAYLLTGAIALSSFAIWSDPPYAALLGKDLAGKEWLAAGISLVFSCALGVILCSLGPVGAEHYRLMSNQRPKTAPRSLLDLWRSAKLFMLRLAFYLPASETEAKVQARIWIAEELSKTTDLRNLAMNEVDKLLYLRAILPSGLRIYFHFTVAYAEETHRRMILAHGVALALLAVALQAVLKATWLFIHFAKTGSGWSFLALAFVASVASISMRGVASWCSEQELFLTYYLALEAMRHSSSASGRIILPRTFISL